MASPSLWHFYHPSHLVKNPLPVRARSQELGVQVRFLVGPAGSGKTFRCLAEIRETLSASPEGAPLLFVAPKQTTYQLERLLLVDPSLPGYTRAHILSFERLAGFILDQL